MDVVVVADIVRGHGPADEGEVEEAEGDGVVPVPSAGEEPLEALAPALPRVRVGDADHPEDQDVLQRGVGRAAHLTDLVQNLRDDDQ